jgi:hypothetical protein
MPYVHPLHQAEAYVDFESLREKFESEPPATYELLLRMCRGARVAGCFSVLINADAPMFAECLDVSARAFLHHLPHIARDARVVSRALPFLDALACGDFVCASLIARLLDAPWQRSYEYEEDHAYYRFLFAWVAQPTAAEAECSAILDDYVRIVEGQPDERLGVARALMTRDADAFDAALRALIQAHKRHYAKMQSGSGIPEAQLLSEGKIFVEGLALIRLAERAGIQVPDDYLYIPSLLRPDHSASFAPDLWRTF